MRNNSSKSTGIKDLPALLQQNMLCTVLAAIVLVQSPFTILYFIAKPKLVTQEAPRHRAANASSKRASLPPKEEAREDPFQLLPGMENMNGQSGVNTAAYPEVFEAFRGVPLPNMQIDSGLGEDGHNDQPAMEVAPLPVELPAAQAQQNVVTTRARTATLKLTGVVRSRGNALAVFQLQDKSTVHTGEGERIAGTDCCVESILQTKVLVRKQSEDCTTQTWLFVGEEWRV